MEIQLSKKFELEFIKPFSTFENGKPKRIPYVIDGLLSQGGFSIMAGKPKEGKTSLATYEAVCVSRGSDFLGRKVEQGEVIVASLEEPSNLTDNRLKILGYDLETHPLIHILEKLPPLINESIDRLGNALTMMPNVRLMIVDTLAKLLRVKDLDKYMDALGAVERLHELARKLPQAAYPSPGALQKSQDGRHLRQRAGQHCSSRRGRYQHRALSRRPTPCHHD